MEDNRITSRELEEMRTQIAMLKQKLDNQTIVSETHIRNSMKSKGSEITKIIASTIFIGALSLPYSTWIFCKFGFSAYFIVASDIMLAVCLGMTIKQRCVLNRLDFLQGNLLYIAEKLNNLRAHYHEWKKIAIPTLLVWAAWLFYEGYKNLDSSPMLIGFLGGSAVGIIIGAIVGWLTNRKIIAKSTDILHQIKDLQSMS